MAHPFVPDAGDVAWITSSPQAGREQSGHRPALVLTPASYNKKTSMMVCCAMTSQLKGYPFEVVVTKNPPSAILVDQIRSLDWRARGATRRGHVSSAVLAEVRVKIRALVGA